MSVRTGQTNPFRRTIAAAPAALVVLAALLAAGPVFSESAHFPVDKLKSGDFLVVMRHARAPGTGDPPEFRIGECATQRNLDDRGRAQARRFGARLRKAGIDKAAVYSSQWCRCMETAELLGLGPVRELPPLNSFYRRPRERAGNLAALEEFIRRLGKGTDRPVILVTHQVTISAMTGGWVKSGEAVIFRLDGTGRPEPAGSIPP